MTRLRIILTATAAAAAGSLGLAAPAWAGTYTWNLPADFTLTGANPDHDRYGGAPWSYRDEAAASSSRLDQFQTNVQGGLSGWTDSGDTAALVGVNPQSQAINGGFQSEDTFPTGAMILEPTPKHAVALRWTSPLAGSLTVSGSVVSAEASSSAAAGCAAAGWDVWALTVNGSPVAGQSGTVPASSAGPQAISADLQVAPGDSVELVLTAGASAAADPACAAAAATLGLQAPVSAPPVSLTQPASGAVIRDGQPAFSGVAADAFGDADTVTVRVYKGTSVDPTALVQTLSVSRSGSAYSAAPDPFLYDGAYTAQSEQDDAVGDHGLSSPVTFQVADPFPLIELTPPPRRVLGTGSPLLTGTAGTIDGDSAQIDVLIWAGSRPEGYPLRDLATARGPTGRWAVRVTPALSPGAYVAVADQNGPAGLIGSQPVRFRVKLSPPAVSLERPASGARLRSRRPILSGHAGSEAGDFRWVTVYLYRGPSAALAPIGRARARVRRDRWSTRWHRPLQPGIYTARALQRDQAGHASWTPPKTFRVL